MGKLKQYFCDHIYKTTKIEKTQTRRLSLCDFMPLTYGYANYQYYAHHQTCLSCEKRRIIKKRKIIL